MLARRIQSRRRSQQTAVAPKSDFYLVDSHFIMNVTKKPDGGFDISSAAANNGSAFQRSTVSIRNGFISSDQIGVFSASSGTRVQQFFRSDFEIDDPQPAPPILSNVIANTNPMVMFRDKLLSTTSTSTTLTWLTLAGAVISTQAKPSEYNWHQAVTADGRSAFASKISSAVKHFGTGDGRCSFTSVPAEFDKTKYSASDSLNSFRLNQNKSQAKLDENIITRIDDAGNISYLNPPEFSDQYPPIPAGAESWELWFGRRQISLISQLLPAGDNIYFVATTSANIVRRGNYLGKVTNQYVASTGVTNQLVDAYEIAYSSRTTTYLYRMNSSGEITRLNLLRQATNVFQPGMGYFDEPSQASTTSTQIFHIARNDRRSGSYVTPRLQRSFEYSSDDVFDISSSGINFKDEFTSIRTLHKFDNAFLLIQNTFPFIYYRVNNIGVSDVNYPGSGAITANIPLENHNTILMRRDLIWYKSEDLGDSWITSPTTVANRTGNENISLNSATWVGL